MGATNNFFVPLIKRGLTPLFIGTVKITTFVEMFALPDIFTILHLISPFSWNVTSVRDLSYFPVYAIVICYNLFLWCCISPSHSAPHYTCVWVVTRLICLPEYSGFILSPLLERFSWEQVSGVVYHSVFSYRRHLLSIAQYLLNELLWVLWPGYIYTYLFWEQ